MGREKKKREREKRERQEKEAMVDSDVKPIAVST